MRVVLLVLWVVLVVALLLPLVRRSLGRRRRPAAALRDELVKDPVCQTYVVRSRAVRALAQGELFYFCSDECARRHASQLGG
jgi:YHS domain-containing protein